MAGMVRHLMAGALVASLVLPAVAWAAPATTSTVDYRFRPQLLKLLVERVPSVLHSQDKKTGRFGTGVFIVDDQNVIMGLAAAWATPDKDNPYYHSPEVLRAIVAGGDALIAAQDKAGRWVFRKKDNSTWGDAFKPWTYSRWIRTYQLVRSAMAPNDRKRWDKALLLGYNGIARGCLDKIHNIPTHHAMGLYFAGKVFGREEWCTTASAFLRQVAATQNPVGFWSEHSGPVVGYNAVYMDALGTYYGVSHDPAILPSLERAAKFHVNFTYPDGSPIETIDERQVYHPGVSMPNVGFTATPLGRGYLREQLARMQKAGRAVPTDAIASLLLYGQEGPADPVMPTDEKQHTFVTSDGNAGVVRNAPWCWCLSAYTSPQSSSRWIQDRQDFASLFHDRTGLLIGGGNTKLQPLWSNFTFGDISLLKHKAGDTDPSFIAPAGLIHIPSEAHLSPDASAISFLYGDTSCSLAVRPESDDVADITMSVADVKETTPVEGHLTFMPTQGRKWQTPSGLSGTIAEGTSFTLTSEQCKGAFIHAGWRVKMPKGSTLTWPVCSHDPYKKDGSSTLEKDRIVLTLPFNKGRLTQVVKVSVPAN